MTAFEITRIDGRSNSQVVVDLAAPQTPGAVFTFEALAEELGKGTEREYDHDAVRRAVLAANRRLLREHQRTLASLRGVGYRLAEAREHQGLALARRRRADRQLAVGLSLLKNVRWGELDAQARQAHVGGLVIMEALYANQQAIERRQDVQEAAIRELVERVDRLDQEA